MRHTTAGGIAFVEASYAPALRLETHRHADAHVCFVLAGSVREVTPRQSYAYARSTLLFRRAGEVHAQEYGGEGARCFSFFIPREWNEKYCVLPSNSDVFAAAPRSRPNHLIRRLYDEFRQPDAYASLAMEGLALELVAEIARARAPRVTGRAADVRAYLEHADDAGRVVRIGTLARDLGVDAAHLVRSFRRAHGISPATFLRRRRLERAYALVVDTDRSLADIATATGFFDQSHFSRAFAALYGITPGTCRRSALVSQGKAT